MDHVAIQKSLTGFYDGELDPAQNQEVAGHLRSCPECSRTLADWSALGKAFFRPSAAPSRAQTELFIKTVMDKIDEEEDSVWIPMRWLVPALGFAAASLFFAVVAPRHEHADGLETLANNGAISADRAAQDIFAPFAEAQ